MALGGSGSDRVMSITVDGSDDTLLVLKMEGVELLNKPFEFEVDCVANVDLLGQDEEIEIDDLLGTIADVKMEIPGDDEARHFNGYITLIQRGERHGRFQAYRLVLRPWFWFLTKRVNSRIFNGKTAKQILEAVFSDYGSDGTSCVEFKLSAPQPVARDYCVQYDETDFDFVCRLMEEEGWSYFFTHAEDAHKLVIANAMSQYEEMPGASITWANSMRTESTMINWYGQKEVRSVSAILLDYDYLDSATSLTKTQAVADALSNTVGPMTVFQYPARVVQNQKLPDKKASTTPLNDRAEAVAEMLGAVQMAYTGKTNARGVIPGTTFELKEADGGLVGAAVGAAAGALGLGGGDPTRAGNYLIVGCRYKLEFADHEAVDDLRIVQQNREGFVAEMVCVNADGANFRPERTTPRPVMHGPQTAVVIGASGNEIETDKHGRVKVQFPWDKRETTTQPLDRSAWIRVAQPHAGKGFGFWSVPRIGEEVLVSFIGGDPDKPIITGSVYNDVNLIAYELPAQATVSGWRTHTSKEGSATTYNELRFDDKKDAEYVWLKAQTNYYRNVGKDAFDMVVGNETVKVTLTRKEVIGENWFVNVVKDVMLDLGKDYHTTVAGDIFVTGKATMQVHLEKDHNSKIGGDMGADVTGKLQLKAGGDLMAKGANVHIKGGSNVTIEAGSSLTLKAGGATVVLGSSGVTIDGPQVKINCGGGGGSATDAAPAAPADAQVHADIKPDKKDDYDKLFKDPIEASQSSS